MFTLYQNTSNFWIRNAFNFPTNCRVRYVQKGNCAVRVCISALVSDNSVCVYLCEVDAKLHK